MTIYYTANKGPYSHILPKFNFPKASYPEYEQYREQQFVVHTLNNGGLPIVFVVKSDRLHIYNDIHELKYTPFGEDLYSRVVGTHEVILRKIVPNLAFFGWIYPIEQRIRPIELFHIWDLEKSVWLDIRRTEMLHKTNFPPEIRLPQIREAGKLGEIRAEIAKYESDGFSVCVKNVNDTGIFFIQ